MIQLALTGVYRARWTHEINEEWTRNLIKNEPQLNPAKIQATADLMNRVVRDSLIEDYQDLIPSFTLPDPGDRHVMAAAVKARADVIITFNLRDFPDSALKPYVLEAVHPDNFILDVANLSPASALAAARACWQRRGRPPITWDEYLSSLGRAKLPKSADVFRHLSSL